MIYDDVITSLQIDFIIQINKYIIIMHPFSKLTIMKFAQVFRPQKLPNSSCASASGYEEKEKKKFFSSR